MWMRPMAAAVSLASCLLVAACDADTRDEGSADQAPGLLGASRSASPGGDPDEVAWVQGMYDVGGHKLFMSCAGPRAPGSPIVVYLHGWTNDTRMDPHRNGAYIRDELREFRVCLYDRRNVGRSETVDAVQTHQDMRHDLGRLLAAAGERPPYILMAASFGGLLAYSYLNHHADQVVGMVLIDAAFPDELSLDRYLPRRFRFRAYAEDDACCTLERNPQYPMVLDLQRFIGREPAVPVVYLASKQEPRNVNEYRSREYDARVLGALERYVDRFSPGRLIWVDAPHFMEPVVPREIADAVRDVAAAARRG
jgi:pimeloyl-ACP methyl ester carboxylesterase